MLDWLGWAKPSQTNIEVIGGLSQNEMPEWYNPLSIFFPPFTFKLMCCGVACNRAGANF
uniref:Uncharacterized protein n=1 Tax=Nelumbo nucifera TaxID=4432 RepID=A0A822ZPN0_NELNU|nr:TPA_asm: hypothetical protein HUJ06_016720 [Nelumbo nucifera]